MSSASVDKISAALGSVLAKNSASHLLLNPKRPRAPRRTPDTVAQLPHIDFQFGDSPAKRIAVHSQLPCSAALISFVLLQDGQYELLFEFAYGFGIEDVTSIHLQDQGFELIFHGVSLSCGQASQLCRYAASAIRRRILRLFGTV